MALLGVETSISFQRPCLRDDADIARHAGFQMILERAGRVFQSNVMNPDPDRIT